MSDPSKMFCLCKGYEDGFLKCVGEKEREQNAKILWNTFKVENGVFYVVVDNYA